MEDKTFILFDNPQFDEAIMGVTEDNRVVYNFDDMVDCLMEEDGLAQEEAVEFIEYNTVRTLPYIGAKSPIIFYRDYDLEELLDKRKDQRENEI